MSSSPVSMEQLADGAVELLDLGAEAGHERFLQGV